MCLTDFIKFKTVKKSDPIIGYRRWRLNIQDPIVLKSLYRDYDWSSNKRHIVKDKNSGGIYSYNNYSYSHYDYNHNNYHYNYKNYNYNYYNIGGTIQQYGKVAIHKYGYRSEYAKIKTLFTIREVDAEDPKKFINSIKEFNLVITNLAIKYKATTIHYQDFLKSNS